MIGNPPAHIIKEYPQRGVMKQYRFEKAIAFSCFRCNSEKKAKLITIYNSNWNKKLCNGCYGRLLSIYEIKAGAKSDDEKVEALANLLLNLVTENEVNISIKRLGIKENRIEYLDPLTNRFLASAEHISSKLDKDYSLDWSPVVIGLCKSFENELVSKIIRPFKKFCKDRNFEEDQKDKDIGRIAKYIMSPNSKDPELGTFGYFLQTSLNSKSRRETSELIKSFYEFLTQYPYSSWVLDKTGLLHSIEIITKEYRNKAAHIEELSQSDFENCKNILIGEQGILWKLNLSIK